MDQKLESAAREVVPSMVVTKMRSLVNSELVRSIDLGFDPQLTDISDALSKAAARSIRRISDGAAAKVSAAALAVKEEELRGKIEQTFVTGTWRSEPPGREILKRFVTKEGLPVGYEVIRNLIVSRMAEVGKKLLGMLVVIDRVRAG